MKVLIIGAAGKTGALVLDKALKAGHDVTILLHEHKKEEHYPATVQVVYGDVRNPTRLDQVMAGQQAVIDVIGGTKPYLETDLESGAAKVVIEVMRRNQVKRLIVVSAMGVADSKEHAGFFYEHLLMPLFLGGIMRDKARMETEVEHSGLDFTIVRPPLLKDSDETRQIHLVTGDAKAHTITRGDLAQFLVDQLTSKQYVGQEVTIANK